MAWGHIYFWYINTNKWNLICNEILAMSLWGWSQWKLTDFSFLAKALKFPSIYISCPFMSITKFIVLCRFTLYVVTPHFIYKAEVNNVKQFNPITVITTGCNIIFQVQNENSLNFHRNNKTITKWQFMFSPTIIEFNNHKTFKREMNEKQLPFHSIRMRGRGMWLKWVPKCNEDTYGRCKFYFPLLKPIFASTSDIHTHKENIYEKELT